MHSWGNTLILFNKLFSFRCCSWSLNNRSVSYLIFVLLIESNIPQNAAHKMYNGRGQQKAATIGFWRIDVFVPCSGGAVEGSSAYVPFVGAALNPLIWRGASFPYFFSLLHTPLRHEVKEEDPVTCTNQLKDLIIQGLREWTFLKAFWQLQGSRDAICLQERMVTLLCTWVKLWVGIPFPHMQKGC